MSYMERQRNQERERRHAQERCTKHFKSHHRRHRHGEHPSFGLAHNRDLNGVVINCPKSRNEQNLRKIPVQEFVQNWLAHIQEDNKTLFHDVDGRKENVPRSTYGRDSLQNTRDFFHHRDENIDSERNDTAPKRYKNHCSSESSFLECASPCSRSQEAPRLSNNSDIQRHHTETSLQRLGITASSLETSTGPRLPKRGETFERHKRHRTNEERYKSNKKLKASETRPKVELQKNKKDREKGKYRRDVRRAGKELMDNFSSRKVGNDRLTMDPSDRLGIFKNGRASSPFGRRGLPDLAFSEMAFLQRSNQHAADSKDQKAVTTPREKDLRKRQRDQEEISSFFKESSKLSTARHISSGRDKQEPYSRDKRDREFPPRKYANPRHRSMSNGSTSRPIGFLATSDLMLGRQDPTLKKMSAQYPPEGDLVPSEARVEDTANWISGGSTTYYTWSESVGSAGARRQGNHCRGSLTPESVRRSLDETGVFENTGIVRSVESNCDSCIRGDIHRGGDLNSASEINQQQGVPEKLPSHNDVERQSPMEKISQKLQARTEATRQQDITGDDDRVSFSIAQSSCLKHKTDSQPEGLISRDHNLEPRHQILLDKRGSESHHQYNKSTEAIPRQVLAEDAYVGKPVPASITENACEGSKNCDPTIDLGTEDTTIREATRDTPKRAVSPRNKSDGDVVTMEVNTGTGGTDKARPPVDKSDSLRKLSSSIVTGRDELMLGVTQEIIPIADQTPRGRAHTPADIFNSNRSSVGISTSQAEEKRTFEGLPVRGSWTSGSLSQVHIMQPELTIEPLYARQLMGRASSGLTAPCEEDTLLTERFQYSDNPLEEDLLIQEEFDGSRAEDGCRGEQLDPNTGEVVGTFMVKDDVQFEPEAQNYNTPEHLGMQNCLDEAQIIETSTTQSGANWTPLYLSHRQAAREYFDHVDEQREDIVLNGFWQPHRHY